MTQQILFTNTLPRPVFIDGQMLSTGQTVCTTLDSIPERLQSQVQTVVLETTEPEPVAVNPIATLLALPINQLDAALASLTMDELQALKTAELASPTPRKGALDLIDAALLQLAAVAPKPAPATATKPAPVPAPVGAK